MDRGGIPMDASQDVWDWEVLLPEPDHRSVCMGHGSKILDAVEDKGTMGSVVMVPSGDSDVRDDVVAGGDGECKDIGVVQDETKPAVRAADPLTTLSDGDDEEEKVFHIAPDADAKMEADDGRSAGEEEEEEEEDVKKDDKPDCVVFSVGKLKVNGIGALCSFGVAAATTVCIFLIGGRLQHQHHRQQQQQKIQLQFYGGDDKRIEQVVQHTSRLNQAMSSVMGAGASTRANISFGGFYDGF